MSSSIPAMRTDLDSSSGAGLPRFPRSVDRISYQPPPVLDEPAHGSLFASRLVTVGLIASLLLSVVIAWLGR